VSLVGGFRTGLRRFLFLVAHGNGTFSKRAGTTPDPAQPCRPDRFARLIGFRLARCRKSAATPKLARGARDSFWQILQILQSRTLLAFGLRIFY